MGGPCAGHYPVRTPMIAHLRHADIDPVLWDERLRAAANASWYGLHATLEAAAPGQWDALVDEATGEQMPLPWRRKLGVRYLFQPFMLQHLGPYAPTPRPGTAERFLHALPRRFRYADINVQGTAVGTLPGARTEPRTNHVLRLDAPLEDLRARYSTNHRRSLRKAVQAGVSIERGASGRSVLGFIENSPQMVRWKADAADRAIMRALVEATEADGSGMGRIAACQGETVAAGWFVQGPSGLIFLKGLANDRGRELRAMHLLIDDVVRESASSGAVFDLAGGNDPQLARFYSGFGAEPVLYLRALINRLPPLVRLMKP